MEINSHIHSRIESTFQAKDCEKEMKRQLAIGNNELRAKVGFAPNIPYIELGKVCIKLSGINIDPHCSNTTGKSKKIINCSGNCLIPRFIRQHTLKSS